MNKLNRKFLSLDWMIFYLKTDSNCEDPLETSWNPTELPEKQRRSLLLTAGNSEKSSRCSLLIFITITSCNSNAVCGCDSHVCKRQSTRELHCRRYLQVILQLSDKGTWIMIHFVFIYADLFVWLIIVWFSSLSYLFCFSIEIRNNISVTSRTPHHP